MDAKSQFSGWSLCTCVCVGKHKHRIFKAKLTFFKKGKTVCKIELWWAEPFSMNLKSYSWYACTYIYKTFSCSG